MPIFIIVYTDAEGDHVVEQESETIVNAIATYFEGKVSPTIQLKCFPKE